MIKDRLAELDSLRKSLSRVSANFQMAKRIACYDNEELVGEVTRGIVARTGCVLFQTLLLALDEKDHISALLNFFKLPQGATVLDAGCGVGGAASLMQEQRPDLDFILLNSNKPQLDQCPEGMAKIKADFHKVPLEDASVDAVMFNYSLGHGLLDQVFLEAARVLKPGGLALVYDLFAYDSDMLIVTVGYNAHNPMDVVNAAIAHGLELDNFTRPAETFISPSITIMNQEYFNTIFANTQVALFRFVKPVTAGPHGKPD